MSNRDLDKILTALTHHMADGRIPVAIVGLVLLLAGARVYRLAVVAPGLLAGVFLAHEGLALADSKPELWMRAAVLGSGGLLGAFVAWRVEQLAVRIAGGLVVAAATHALLPLAWPDAPSWGPLLVGTVGLLIAPSLYRRLLPLITAALGSVAVAWAAGEEQNLLLMAGLTVVGAGIQMASGRSKSKD